jgi:hypothetical protein
MVVLFKRRYIPFCENLPRPGQGSKGSGYTGLLSGEVDDVLDDVF